MAVAVAFLVCPPTLRVSRDMQRVEAAQKDKTK
jgi:hypothetical protein